MQTQHERSHFNTCDLFQTPFNVMFCYFSEFFSLLTACLRYPLSLWKVLAHGLTVHQHSLIAILEYRIDLSRLDVIKLILSGQHYYDRHDGMIDYTTLFTILVVLIVCRSHPTLFSPYLSACIRKLVHVHIH